MTEASIIIIRASPVRTFMSLFVRCCCGRGIACCAATAGLRCRLQAKEVGLCQTQLEVSVLVAHRKLAWVAWVRMKSPRLSLLLSPLSRIIRMFSICGPPFTACYSSGHLFAFLFLRRTADKGRCTGWVIFSSLCYLVPRCPATLRGRRAEGITYRCLRTTPPAMPASSAGDAAGGGDPQQSTEVQLGLPDIAGSQG